MEEIVTLASIANGSVLELFDHELKRVISNIADPNTSPKKKRQIIIKVDIQPSDSREIGYYSVEVSAKLASIKPVESTMYFGKDKTNGQFVAVQNNPSQPSIFDETPTNVTPLTAVDRKAASANDR
jgi:hypothetical protein